MLICQRLLLLSVAASGCSQALLYKCCATIRIRSFNVIRQTNHLPRIYRSRGKVELATLVLSLQVDGCRPRPRTSLKFDKSVLSSHQRPTRACSTVAFLDSNQRSVGLPSHQFNPLHSRRKTSPVIALGATILCVLATSSVTASIRYFAN